MKKTTLALPFLLLTLFFALLPRTQSEHVSAGALSPRSFLPLLIQPPQDKPFGPVHTGEGTYYWEADGSGNCSFPATPDDLMVAAMNETDYGTADLCGAYVQAEGPAGSVLVRIVDRCPECAPGDIDFSPEAFARIADLPQGRVPISWQLVSRALTTPVEYYFEPSSSQWWTAVQIRNHRNPITKLEFWNGTAWEAIPRVRWNYFISYDGLGSGPYTFRITDYFGHTLVDTDIPLQPGSSIAGAAQFPPPP